MAKPEVLFILSVDTEEEWDWSGPFPNSDFSVDNAKELPAFQNFCQELGIKPTYLVDYAIANDPYAVSILNGFNQNECEIGAHLHPWANPPFFNETSEFTSHVVNLPIEHVEQKLAALVEKIEENFKLAPNCFRTGRWGINGEVIELLEKYNISVDSSAYPLYVNKYFSCEQAPCKPYWPALTDTNLSGQQKAVLEIPVTTGFNRSATQLCQTIHKACEHKPLSWLRLNGLLWHSLLLRKLYLSPELCTSSDMIRLVKTQLQQKQQVFHMFMHSSTLVERVTGLNNEPHARELLCQRIKDVIHYMQQYVTIKFCTLSEAQTHLIERGMTK